MRAGAIIAFVRTSLSYEDEAGAGAMSYVRTVVAEPDTMSAIGTGDLPVLAIPRLLALADLAAVEAIAPSLEFGHDFGGFCRHGIQADQPGRSRSRCQRGADRS